MASRRLGAGAARVSGRGGEPPRTGIRAVGPGPGGSVTIGLESGRRTGIVLVRCVGRSRSDGGARPRWRGRTAGSRPRCWTQRFRGRVLHLVAGLV